MSRRLPRGICRSLLRVSDANCNLTLESPQAKRRLKEMAKIGRPRIDGLERFSLRLVRSQLDEIDAVVTEERVSRRDPALTRTDIVREALSEYFLARGRART
jgi:hypothetical protein